MGQAEFPIVKANGKATYRSIADRFSPGLRDALLDFSLSSGLSEADCIYWILSAQADLYDAQTKALLSALGSVHGNGEGNAPQLNPAHIEKLKVEFTDAVTRALHKRRDDVALLSALDQMPRLVGNHLDKLLQERMEDFRRELTPEKEGEGRRWPAWIRKSLAFVSRRWFIAIAGFVFGILTVHFADQWHNTQRAEQTNHQLISALGRLPDAIRMQLAGNMTFSPAADGKPAKVSINFGQKFRPVTAEVTRSGEVSVVFAP